MKKPEGIVVPKSTRIPEPAWKRSVLKQLRHWREDVVPVGSGRACSLLRMEEFPCKEDRKGTDRAVGCLAAAGIPDAADGLLPLLRTLLAAGGKPFGLSGVLLLPGNTPEEKLREQAQALERECEGYGLEILQLEPRIVKAVLEPLLTVTVYAWKQEEMPAIDVHTGQEIVMAGWAGLSGMSGLLRQYRAALEGHFPGRFLQKAERMAAEAGLSASYSAAWEQLEIARSCGVAAAQAAGEGGILDAFWRLGEGAGCGMELLAHRIPIRQETIEITGFLHLNPYQIDSGGAFVFAAEEGSGLCGRLREEGYSAVIVGRILDGKERYLAFGEEKHYLEPYRGEG